MTTLPYPSSRHQWIDGASAQNDACEHPFFRWCRSRGSISVERDVATTSQSPGTLGALYPLGRRILRKLLTIRGHFRPESRPAPERSPLIRGNRPYGTLRSAIAPCQRETACLIANRYSAYIA